MAVILSNMLALGTKAPKFTLRDTISGKLFSYDDSKGIKGTVVMFICNHCPFVIHINKELVRLANDCIPKGISFIAISANDVENYPQDAPELMAIVAEREKYSFPYLYDETQEVAKEYLAACTPDFYLFDRFDSLVYRGQLDDSRPNNGIAISGKDMRKAIDLLLKGKSLPENLQKPSIGCAIKWK